MTSEQQPIHDSTSRPSRDPATEELTLRDAFTERAITFARRGDGLVNVHYDGRPVLSLRLDELQLVQEMFTNKAAPAHQEVRILTVPSETSRALDAVAEERDRQRRLLCAGAISHDCADPSVCIDRKLRTLAEEFGEVAAAIDNVDRATFEASALIARENLREELVQVAAVAVAIVESLTESEERAPLNSQPSTINSCAP